ncbi:Zinc-finger CCCH domain [Dillenia turbinata]|uniref:Zinc-finger CCCH domain n=1 Tax=Dillenia turbinata TaxID=194707 RepID=A0AAN8VWN6_9MAGN
MDDELQKRFTDCVYFLASPLTCKKGIECEYRHSEIARLNTRDCWYWLSGGCLNPTCAFRHPPLDVHSEASSGFAPFKSQSSMTVNKTNVPCYFYFNGFCNKGDRCSFFHGSDGDTASGKSLKTASAVADAPQVENKLSTGGSMGLLAGEKQSVPCETAQKAMAEIQYQVAEDIRRLAVNNVVEDEIASPVLSTYEHQEAVVMKSDSLIPTKGFVQHRSILCFNESSEEEVDDLLEPEEQWESSPGFDVLVDNGSEDLCYDENPENLQVIDGEERNIEGHLLQYDYEEYDPSYPDAGIFFEHELHGEYSHLDNEHTFEYVREISCHSRERIIEPMTYRKRKLLPTKAAGNGRSALDLREHLRKRRIVDVCAVSHSSRRWISSHIHRTQERHPRPGRGRWLPWRLASVVEKNNGRSWGEQETMSNVGHRRGLSKHPCLNRSASRKHSEAKAKRQSKRHFLSSAPSRKHASRENRYNQEGNSFAGPKTLEQIREEKRKAKENRDCFKVGCASRSAALNFEGPKPLSEILKGKKRGSAVKDENAGSDSKLEPERDYDSVVKGNSLEEDDQGFEQKLASIGMPKF